MTDPSANPVTRNGHEARHLQQAPASPPSQFHDIRDDRPTDVLIQALSSITKDGSGSGFELGSGLELLVPRVESCSLQDLASVIGLLEGLVVVPQHDIGSRKTELKLLVEIAARSDLGSLQSRVLHLSVHPDLGVSVCDQIAAIYYALRYTEAREETEEVLAPILLHRVAQYAIDHLPGVFDSAEIARKKQHDIRKSKGGTDDARLDQRPYEEVALLRALKILRILIRLNADVVAIHSGQVFPLSTQFLKRTTGQTIATAILEVIEMAFLHSAKHFVELSDCVQLVCQISNSVNPKAQAPAYHTLLCTLASPIGTEVLNALVENILVVTTCEESLKIVALNAIAEVYFSCEASQRRRDTFAADFSSLSHKLKLHMLPEVPVAFARSLLKILLAIYPDVRDDSFEAAFELIGRGVRRDLENTPFRTTELAFVQNMIDLFLRCYHHHGTVAARIYDILILLVTAAESVKAKLDIIKLLARLRCDQSQAVKIVETPDALNLAAGLCRTQATAGNVRESGSPASRVSSNSRSSLSKTDGSQKSLKMARTRSRSRSSPQKFRESFRVASQPLWMYGEGRKGVPGDISERPSQDLFVQIQSNAPLQRGRIDPDSWLSYTINVLRNGHEWEIYSYILVHLPSQLSNSTFFRSCVKNISVLHDLLSAQLGDGSFPDAPPGSNIRKGDIALCLYNALAMLLGYQECIGVRQWNRVVSVFRLGIEKWDRTGKFCIHILAICCHELPHIISNHLNVIVEMMQKRITHFEIAADILEFLGGLSRLSDAWSRSDFSLHQKIFSICIRYLQHSREQRAGSSSVPDSPGPASNRASISVIAAHTAGQPGPVDLTHRKLHEYVFTTAYQVMIFWFLALDVSDRHRHVAWITQELSFRTDSGKEEMEPQSLVFLDMMHRTTFSDLGETKASLQFMDLEKNVHRRTWLMGLSIITAEFLVNDTGRISHGQFTKRQASGTTHAIYFHNTEEMPAHHTHLARHTSGMKADPFAMYPNHMILQLMSTISPLPAPLQPIPLPEDDDFTDRVIRQFDSTDTVDGHKAAVIYIGRGQTKELDILANSQGSPAFEFFLSKLAYKVPLKDAKFNTQGLDHENESDGLHTYAWRDRVTEIVFHIPSMMPTDNENDPSCTRKKSHIGNDHVKIIFNESGLSFNENAFASDFNNVNIVVTPEAQLSLAGDPTPSHISDTAAEGRTRMHDVERETYYIVQTLTSNGFPAIAPTVGPKLVSASSLPTLIRQLALNASVLCSVWSENVGEFTSCWLFRLQQIMRLRERHANANVSSNVGYPQAADAGPSPHVEGQIWSGPISHGGLAEPGKLVSSLDFTRWTK